MGVFPIGAGLGYVDFLSMSKQIAFERSIIQCDPALTAKALDAYLTAMNYCKIPISRNGVVAARDNPASPAGTAAFARAVGRVTYDPYKKRHSGNTEFLSRPEFL